MNAHVKPICPFCKQPPLACPCTCVDVLDDRRVMNALLAYVRACGGNADEGQHGPDAIAARNDLESALHRTRDEKLKTLAARIAEYQRDGNESDNELTRLRIERDDLEYKLERIREASR